VIRSAFFIGAREDSQILVFLGDQALPEYVSKSKPPRADLATHQFLDCPTDNLDPAQSPHKFGRSIPRSGRYGFFAEYFLMIAAN
jgi:hypothetical protein